MLLESASLFDIPASSFERKENAPVCPPIIHLVLNSIRVWHKNNIIVLVEEKSVLFHANASNEIQGVPPIDSQLNTFDVLL